MHGPRILPLTYLTSVDFRAKLPLSFLRQRPRAVAGRVTPAGTTTRVVYRAIQLDAYDAQHPHRTATIQINAATIPLSCIVKPRCVIGLRLIYLEKIPLENRSRS
jgi:hypothetical protein